MYTCPEEATILSLKEVAVDNCPERMYAADTEASRPPRIETAVEF